jgi:hypothetical protein
MTCNFTNTSGDYKRYLHENIQSENKVNANNLSRLKTEWRIRRTEQEEGSDDRTESHKELTQLRAKSSTLFALHFTPLCFN